MDGPALEMRSATDGDAPSIARLVHDCFLTFQSFMGSDWEPPTLDWHTADLEHRLQGVGVRTRMALSSPQAAHDAGSDPHALAFCGWMPARTDDEAREPVPGLAHLWMLFVGREQWGSGLGAELLGWARTGMLAAGYDAARLWTPTGQARARAFYERRGWCATGRDHFSPELGLPVLEYRLDLP
jgi:GNAT superfamily N-acetyltransferase